MVHGCGMGKIELRDGWNFGGGGEKGGRIGKRKEAARKKIPSKT